MKSLKIILISLLFLCFGFSTASAVNIYLLDYAFNIDGAVSEIKLRGDPVPAEVDISAFDDVTGLGSISISTSGAGAHSILGFFDHEIDERINTFFNEHGTTSGTPAAGQSWEIDEPGFVFGDIYDNLQDGALDNSNGVPAGSEDDVSMAMGWDFILSADETAIVSFVVTQDEPEGGVFYLKHRDPNSNAEIYFISSLNIEYTHDIQIDQIIEDFDENVEEGQIEGTGPGSSASGRLNAFGDMLDEAQAYIDAGDFTSACEQLEAAHGKCDGESPPPDFITGDAALQMAASIQELMNTLGCE